MLKIISDIPSLEEHNLLRIFLGSQESNIEFTLIEWKFE
jgi:hypothetical protein